MKQIIANLRIPQERIRQVEEKIWLIWNDRIEEQVIVQQALGFPEIKDLLARISRG
jgi:hypothetical protein